MDIETMHLGVDLHVDKSSAIDLPSFTTEEKDYWINEAIKRFVKTRYSGLNPKRESFEQTQKRLDDLRTLVEPVDLTMTAVGSTYSNGYINSTVIPVDYWFMVGEEATITVGSTSSRVEIIECTQNELSKRLNSPLSEHILHYNTAKPLRIFYGTSVELIGDGNYTINTYHLTYIKQPEEVEYSTGTDCDLPVHTHDEIVKLAADLMLENIESERQQTHAMLTASME